MPLSNGCELPLGSVTAANQCKFDGETLVVSSSAGAFSEAYRSSLGQLFEETTGARLEWVEQTSDISMTQLIAAGDGTPPIDVVLDMYVPGLYTADPADIFYKQDEAMWRAQVPNMADLPSEAFNVEGYAPAAYYFIVGACINTAKFEAANAEIPTTWEEIVSQDVGVIGFPLPDNARWNLIMAALAEHYGTSMDDPQPVLDALGDVENLVFYPGTTGADQMLQNDEAAVVIHSDGRCNGLNAAGVPVEWGSLGLVVDGTEFSAIAGLTTPEIAKNTEHLDLALTLLNTLFTPEGLGPLTAQFIYSPLKSSVLEYLQADPAVEPYLVTSSEGLLFPDYRSFIEHSAAWIDAWNRTFQS